MIGIKKKEKINIINNAICINKFFEEIQKFTERLEGKKDESLNNKNLLVLALNFDTNKRDIEIFSFCFDEINSTICPIIVMLSHHLMHSSIKFIWMQ